MTGLPRLPKPPFRRAVPTTPADRAGAHVDCFPAHAAFPKWQEGRHPHWDFRGLLGLHSCYGPLNCSTAHGGLCHEASTQMVAHPSRSSATGAIDNSPGGSYRHWRHTHTGRTSFDHLVGEREQLVWNLETERPGGLQVDNKVELGSPHYLLAQPKRRANARLPRAGGARRICSTISHVTMKAGALDTQVTSASATQLPTSSWKGPGG